MKKTRFFLFGLPALLLAWGLFLAGCDNGSTSGDGYAPPAVDVQGRFTHSSQAVAFYAGDHTPRSIRAAAGDGYPLTGKMQYGATVMTVEGTYIPAEKVFRASAISGNISFEIEGELDEQYHLKNATVRVVTKSSGKWDQAGAATASVTPAADVDIPGAAEPFPTEGVVPAEFRGKWVLGKDDMDKELEKATEEVAKSGIGITFNQVSSYVIITPMAIRQNVAFKATVSFQGQSQVLDQSVDRALDLVSVSRTDGVTTATVRFEEGTERPYTMEISGTTLTMASTAETVHFVK
jgi:hypothetical protein